MQKIKQVTKEVIGFIVIVAIGVWLILSLPLIILAGKVFGKSLVKGILTDVSAELKELKEKIEEEEL